MKKCSCGKVFARRPAEAVLHLDVLVPGFYYNCPACHSTIVFEARDLDDENTIWGWKGIREFTDLGDTFLRRAIAYYGFPKPTFHTKGERHGYIWSKNEVNKWLENYQKEQAVK